MLWKTAGLLFESKTPSKIKKVIMKERDGGFYYLQLVNLNWIIGYWDVLEGWKLPGETKKYKDDDFLTIDEKPIKIPYWINYK